MQSFEIVTHARDQMLDLSSKVQQIVTDQGLSDGLAVVFVPHTTAGVTINEGADPAVAEDILGTLDNRVPRVDQAYRHREGNSASHIKASLMGSSVTVPFVAGRLALGTWQAIFLCEFDGPRRRKVQVSLVSA
jgi:secondary thiamine-phosphate synthase enzyme